MKKQTIIIPIAIKNALILPESFDFALSPEFSHFI